MGLFGWIILLGFLLICWKFPMLLMVLGAIGIGKWMDDVARK